MLLFETSIVVLETNPLSRVQRDVVTVRVNDLSKTNARRIAIAPTGVPITVASPATIRASLPAFVINHATGPTKASGNRQPIAKDAVAFPSGFATHKTRSPELFKV